MAIKDTTHPYESDVGIGLIEKSVSALLQQCKDQQAPSSCDGKKSVFADAPQLSGKAVLNLDIQSFKVPVSELKRSHRPLHPKIRRFELPHTLTSGHTAVLLVTKDYPKKGNTAISNAHYLQMITSEGCNHLITEIMSVSQLNAEYFDKVTRKELCDRIDVVLCDSPLASIVPRMLGREFLQAKKFPISVKLGKKNLKKVIEGKLSTVAHKMTFKNVQSSLPFGVASHTMAELNANLSASLAYLCTSFPGGWDNVKTLYLTMGLKGRVPLYVSTGRAADVPDILVSKKELEVFEGDFGFGNVKVTADGTVLDYEPASDDEETHAIALVHRRMKSKKRREVEDLAKLPAAKKIKSSENKIIKKKVGLNNDTETNMTSKVTKVKNSKAKQVAKEEQPSPVQVKHSKKKGNMLLQTETKNTEDKQINRIKKERRVKSKNVFEKDAGALKLKRNKTKGRAKKIPINVIKIHTTLVEEDFE